MILTATDRAQDIILTTRNNEGYIRMATTPSYLGSDFERMTITPNGYVGIGEINPTARLEIKGFGDDEYSTSLHIMNSSDASLLLVRDDGEIRIGDEYYTQAMPAGFNYRLSVDGQVVAKEVYVTLDDWADFVFDDDYDLTPLYKLEEQINENGHLPGIPTAEEIAKTGVNLGEMQAKLLQKIEELTLYVIDLKKENDGLQEQIDELK